ncbi:CoA-binding protein [bacterium]|nr:CoA-binding protein [bacterium]
MEHDDNQEAQQQGIDYQRLFEEIETVAVVGYSDKPARAGHFVSQYLAGKGYKIIAVNPKFGGEVDGLPCYASLEAIPQGTRIDVVDVFRNPAHVPAVLEEAAKMSPLPKYFWMQPGAENAEAAARATELGLIPIMDACMMAEHKALDSP